MEYLGENKLVNSIQPVVSVCIQVYNNEEFIEKCIRNALNQITNFTYEIIIGEDDSTDDTRAICKELAGKNQDKIRLFLRDEKNKIYHKGRKTSRYNFIANLNAAKGKYIALCDGDDYWINSNKLQLQYNILEINPEIVATHHWQKNAIFENNKWKEKKSPMTYGFGYQEKIIGEVKDIFKNEMRIKARTVMFRNIVAGDFLPNWFSNVSFADISLSFLLGKHGKFYFLKEEMAVYRQGSDGLSKSGLKELGLKAFRVEHFKNYIEIWDFADKHYGFEYHKEAVNTVTRFYKIIFSNLPASFKSFISLLWYNLFERKLSIFRTLPQTKLILLFYGKLISSKVKGKLLFK